MFRCFYAEAVVIIPLIPSVLASRYKMVYPKSVIIFHKNAIFSSVDIKCFYPKSVIRHHHLFTLLPYMLVSASFEYVAGISWKIGRQDNVGSKKHN